jgi:hypothetical protein
MTQLAPDFLPAQTASLEQENADLRRHCDVMAHVLRDALGWRDLGQYHSQRIRRVLAAYEKDAPSLPPSHQTLFP